MTVPFYSAVSWHLFAFDTPSTEKMAHQTKITFIVMCLDAFRDPILRRGQQQMQNMIQKRASNLRPK